MVFGSQRKLALFACFFSSLFLLSGCFLDLKRAVEIASDNQEQLPIRELTITIDPSQRQDLFDQLHGFADKQGFKYLYTDYGTGGKRFMVELLRKDVKLLAMDIPDAPTMISVDLYDESFTEPVTAEARDTIDDLVSRLKTFINKIPNAMITEQRESLRIKLDKSQRQELLTRMRKLADEHALKFTLTLSADKTAYHVEIHGDGFHIRSASFLNPPGEIVIDFFIDYYQIPTPASLEMVDELYNELRNSLSEIPNVTITEMK